MINSTGPSTGGGRRRTDLRGIFAIAHVALQCQAERCGTCVREVGCVSGAEEQPEEPTAASAHQCDQCAASVASSSRTVAGGAAVPQCCRNRINAQMAAGASAASMRVLVAAMRCVATKSSVFLRLPRRAAAKTKRVSLPQRLTNDSQRLSLSRNLALKTPVQKLDDTRLIRRPRRGTTNGREDTYFSPRLGRFSDARTAFSCSNLSLAYSKRAASSSSVPAASAAARSVQPQRAASARTWLMGIT